MKNKFIILFIISIVCSVFVYGQTTSISIGNVTANPGEEINVPIEVSDLTDVGAITLYISYDPAVLVFQGLNNVHPEVSGMGGNAMTNPDRIGIVWTAPGFPPDYANISSGKMLDLNFVYIGGTCDLVFLSGCDLTDSNLDPIVVNYSDGSVEPSSQTVTATIGSVTASPGEEVLVPVDVTDFLDVGAITFFIGYDENVLTFVGLENINSEVAGIANNEADILMNFLDAGTASAEKTLIIAGDDIAYRQRSHSGQSDYEFCHDYLHALYRKNDGQGSSGMHSIIGVAINPGIVDSIDSGDPDVVSVLAPADTGYVFGPDCDEPDSACCVVYDGATYNTIYYTMEWQDIKADIIQVFLGPPGDRTQGNFGWTGNAGGTLPVELASFTVTVANQFVTLQWTTQTETDNLGFNVLRATTDEVNDAVKVNHNIISGQGTSSVPTEYSYVDNSELIPETTYWYWLESIDYQGNSELYGSISVKFELEEEPSIIPELPDKYGLFQNYPNPFNPNTQIYFRIAEECHGELSIYNIKGEKLATLYEGNIEKDKVITVSWDGKDETGKEVGSGIYFYKLETDKKSYLRKMIILK